VNIRPAANVLAHENVLNQMMEPPPGQPAFPNEALPIETYAAGKYTLSQFFNGEGVQVFHAPEAHTNGDSIVFFRYSDVIAAGDILRTDSYPVIDVERGGTINGVIDGLNLILDIAVPEFRSQGGTLIIPGHGRLCDTGDVANYRNMVTIIRDRVQALIDQGKTLAQVREARPTGEYDGWYASNTSDWTAEMFVEAVYRSLSGGQ
jgi:glyoxylase-like metal-dependent hydrolase (beta-lactamase superfamily II)